MQRDFSLVVFAMAYSCDDQVKINRLFISALVGLSEWIGVAIRSVSRSDFFWLSCRDFRMFEDSVPDGIRSGVREPS